MAEATVSVQTRTIYLEFDKPADREMHLRDLSELFTTLDEILTDLQSIGELQGQNYFYGYGNVDVVSVEMRSPLKLLLAVGRIPKEVVRAFVGLVEKIMFYDEERLTRRALAASAWEDVYAKRLKNVKTAIEIASSNPENIKEIWTGPVERLVQNVIRLERIELPLKKIKSEGYDE